MNDNCRWGWSYYRGRRKARLVGSKPCFPAWNSVGTPRVRLRAPTHALPELRLWKPFLHDSNAHVVCCSGALAPQLLELGTRTTYQTTIPTSRRSPWNSVSRTIRDHSCGELWELWKVQNVDQSPWNSASEHHSCQDLMCRDCQSIAELRIHMSCLDRRIAYQRTKNKSHFADPHGTPCSILEVESRLKSNALTPSHGTPYLAPS